MKTNFHLNVDLVVALLVIFVVLSACYSAAGANNTPSPIVTSTSYTPSDYGLPDSLLDYRVLAVLTPQNTACMTGNSRRVIFHAPQPDASAFLTATTPQNFVQALTQVSQQSDIDWQVQIVGPETSLQTLLDENDKWNKHAAQFGCVSTGGGVPTP